MDGPRRELDTSWVKAHYNGTLQESKAVALAHRVSRMIYGSKLWRRPRRTSIGSLCLRTSSSSFFSVTSSQSPSTVFWLGRWSRLRFKSISTTRRRTRGALVPWPTSPSRRSIARLWHGLCEDNPLLGFLSLVCFVERGLMVGAGELDCS